MEGKSRDNRFVAVILLAVLIVLGAGVLLFLKVGYGVPKLNQTGELRENIPGEAEEAVAAEMEAAEEAGSVFSTSVADFAITAGGVEAQAQDVAEEAEAGEAYLCSFSSQRRMTEEDIYTLWERPYEEFPADRDIIQMVVNELYARHGYQFTNPEIQAWFDRKPWYQDIPVKSSDMDSIYQEMSDIEKDNLTLLMSFREG